MDARLHAWLVDGEPPDDPAALLAEHPGAAEVLEDYAAIDAAAAALSPIEAPPGLFEETLASLLATIGSESAPTATGSPEASVVADEAGTPSRRAPAPQPLVDPALAPEPANRPSRGRLPWLGGLALVATAALALLTFVDSTPDVGDPRDFVARGNDETVPRIEMFVAVKDGEGAIERHRRGEAYAAGDTLLFRYDAGEPGQVHLVRVDGRGASVLHVAEAGAGTADLLTDGVPLGYELERGEQTAVFALISHDERVPASTLAARLSVGPDPHAVCEAARDLGAGCDAVLVEGVR